MANALGKMTFEEKIANALGGNVAGARARKERSLYEAEAAKAMREELATNNALRQLAGESFRPGAKGALSADDIASKFAGAPGAQQFDAPGMTNALAPSGFSLPEKSTPATRGSLDRAGFEQKAVEQGIGIDQIYDFLGKMDESERKAFQKEVKDLENAATYVLFEGPEKELMPRFQSTMKALAHSGVDVSKYKDLGTPEEVKATLSPFIEQAKLISTYNSRRTADKYRNRRTSTAGIVTEKDAWNAVKRERERILKEKAASWTPEDVDVDALMEEFVDTEIPEKFRPYIRKTRGMGPKGKEAPKPLEKSEGKRRPLEGFYKQR